MCLCRGGGGVVRIIYLPKGLNYMNMLKKFFISDEQLDTEEGSL